MSANPAVPVPDEASRRIQDAAKAAHGRGFAAHPDVVLGFSEYFDRICEWTVCDDAQALVARIEKMEAADYYLASACELGCPGAWDRLTNLYQSRFRAMALRWGASASDADEIARELPGELLGKPAHGRCATRIGSFDGTGSLLAWCGTVIDRALARRRRKQSRETGAELDARPDDGGSPPPDAVVHTETGRRVHDAFETALLDLSAREFLIVKGKFGDGRSQKEIAQQLGISEPRVSNLLKRAIDRIRNAVLREVPDETAAHWMDRDGLRPVLKDAISSLLSNDP